jgi:hypothetical protein
VADIRVSATVTTVVAGAWDSHRTVRRASEESRSQRVRAVALSGAPILRKVVRRGSGESVSSFDTVISSQAISFFRRIGYSDSLEVD